MVVRWRSTKTNLKVQVQLVGPEIQPWGHLSQIQISYTGIARWLNRIGTKSFWSSDQEYNWWSDDSINRRKVGAFKSSNERIKWSSQESKKWSTNELMNWLIDQVINPFRD